MADSFSKKENSKKKAQKLNEKAKRREERKSNNNKGKSLEEMFVYVDQYGNLTDVHPDQQKEEQQKFTKTIQRDTIDKEHTGVVTYYSDKGYGFITQDNSKDSLFVHSSDVSTPLTQGDKVSFKKQKTTKGLRALEVKII